MEHLGLVLRERAPKKRWRRGLTGKVLGALGRQVTREKAGRLAHLDQVAVGIAYVTADL
jgi:hypothetical protein